MWQEELNNLSLHGNLHKLWDGQGKSHLKQYFPLAKTATLACNFK